MNNTRQPGYYWVKKNDGNGGETNWFVNRFESGAWFIGGFTADDSYFTQICETRILNPDENIKVKNSNPQIISPYTFAGLPASIPTIKNIFEQVCDYYKIKPEKALQKGRTANIIKCRHMAAYILSKRGFSNREIAKFYGQHRTNIIDSIKVIGEYLSIKKENEYKTDFKAIWDKF